MAISHPTLSILILSVPRRVASGAMPRLVAKVTSQADRHGAEVLCLLDNRSLSVGAKRDWLVKMARGDHVAFLDDDDDVSDDYVASLVEAGRVFSGGFTLLPW